MASVPSFYQWKVSCVPLQETEVKYYQNLEQARRRYSGDYFKVNVRVRHQTFSTQPQPPSDLIIYQKFVLLSSSQFLEDGAAYLLRHFLSPIIPIDLLASMMPQIKPRTMALLQNPPPGFPYQSANFRVFALVMDIMVQKIYDDLIKLIVPGMVPAAPPETATDEPPEEEKQEEGAAKEQCSICLEEFVEGVEVSETPCKHAYHQECATRWLQRSHTCPLCRRLLPH